jgi:hypothetical protein
VSPEIWLIVRCEKMPQANGRQPESGSRGNDRLPAGGWDWTLLAPHTSDRFVIYGWGSSACAGRSRRVRSTS